MTVFPKGTPALQRKTLPKRLKYGKFPHEVGILCRHRRAKTRRLGLCPKCYEAYMKVVNPEMVERKNARMRAFHAANREARIAVSRALTAKRPTWKTRDSWLRHLYGLTVFQYNAILEDQGHSCRICQDVPKRRLSVDHDHKTGRVRGLLCWRCNRGLEIFRDDPDRMWAAVQYLASKFDGRHVKVKRRNTIEELEKKVVAAGEPVRITHNGKKLVVMTAEVWEAMNGKRTEQIAAADNIVGQLEDHERWKRHVNREAKRLMGLPDVPPDVGMADPTFRPEKILRPLE